jgi:hypothetical protein
MMSGSQTVCVAAPAGPVCTEVRAPRLYTDNASFQWNQAAQQVAGAWDNVSLATAARDLAKANLDSMLAQRANPLLADAQVDGAAAQFNVAETVVKEAEAALAAARAGASVEQIRLAQAGVAQAGAAVLSLQVMLDKSTLTAQSVQPGQLGRGTADALHRGGAHRAGEAGTDCPRPSGLLRRPRLRRQSELYIAPGGVHPPGRADPGGAGEDGLRRAGHHRQHRPRPEARHAGGRGAPE